MNSDAIRKLVPPHGFGLPAITLVRCELGMFGLKSWFSAESKSAASRPRCSLACSVFLSKFHSFVSITNND